MRTEGPAHEAGGPLLVQALECEGNDIRHPLAGPYHRRKFTHTPVMESVMPRFLLMLTVLATLIALPSMALAGGRAFDEDTVADHSALAGVRQVHVAMPLLALELDVRQFDTRGNGDRPVRPRDAQTKAEDLRRILIQRLGQDHTVVEAPGPGVLVIRPSLTWLAASRPTIADFEHTPGLSHDSVYAGGAAVRFTLERDGQALGVLGERHVGSLADGNPRIGIWTDTDEAFQRWARALERELSAD